MTDSQDEASDDCGDALLVDVDNGFFDELISLSSHRSEELDGSGTIIRNSVQEEECNSGIVRQSSQPTELELRSSASESMMSASSSSSSSSTSSSAAAADLSWRLVNPVHMQLQENSKLPTFNLDVDRTGSVSFTRQHRWKDGAPGIAYDGAEPRDDHDYVATDDDDSFWLSIDSLFPTAAKAAIEHDQEECRLKNQERDGNLSVTESTDAVTAASNLLHDSGTATKSQHFHPEQEKQQLSLTERFLQTRTRQSIHSAYAYAGALRDHHPASHRPRHSQSIIAANDKQCSHMQSRSVSSRSTTGKARNNHLTDEEKKVDYWEEHLYLQQEQESNQHHHHNALDDIVADDETNGGCLAGESVNPTPIAEMKLRNVEPFLTYTNPPGYHGGRYRTLPIPTPHYESVASHAGSEGDCDRNAPAAISNGRFDVKAVSLPLSPGLDFDFAQAVTIADAIAVAQLNRSNLPQVDTSESLLNNCPQLKKRQSDLSSTADDESCQQSSAQRRRLTKTTASIDRASKQKSQYGFGPKHIVPSVPASLEATKFAAQTRQKDPLRPTRQKSKQALHSQKQQHPRQQLSQLAPQTVHTESPRTINVPLSKQILHSDSMSCAGSVASSVPKKGGNQNIVVVNAGPAYERKKQRAKDSRVRLNESIDKLVIAIDFAGSQSQQRLVQWNELGSVPNSFAATNADEMFDEDATGLRQTFLDCMNVARDAKKWDRPSFVGNAADMIHRLNAQCEMLMREVASCRALSTVHRQQQQPIGTTPCLVVKLQRADFDQVDDHEQPSDALLNSNGDPVIMIHCSRENSCVSLHREQAEECGVLNSSPPPAGEPLSSITTKMDKESITEATVWTTSRTTSTISDFLDPVTLSRCNLVSKQWRQAFSSSARWFSMAIDRFGSFNVRQWKGKLDDEDEGISCSPFTLYNSMDRSNTLPRMDQEGMFLLGETYLPGKVSAWTFLMERSNGETQRSVLRRKDMPGNGTYTSIPIVELRTVVQNIGCHDGEILIRRHLQTIDASTRRRGVIMKEVDWDNRFRKKVLNLDGTPRIEESETRALFDSTNILCGLKLFDAILLVTYIHAQGCSTTSKFIQRSNFTKVLIQIHNSTTIPLVISFPRDLLHRLEH